MVGLFLRCRLGLAAWAPEGRMPEEPPEPLYFRGEEKGAWELSTQMQQIAS